MNYNILNRSQISDPKSIEQILKIWQKLSPDVPISTLLSRIDKIVLAIYCVDEGRIIGMSTVKLKLDRIYRKLYYELGVVVEPGHSNRPLLLKKTIVELEKNKDKDAKGVLVLRKNKKVSDKFLKRLGFTKIQDDYRFYKDF